MKDLREPGPAAQPARTELRVAAPAPVVSGWSNSMFGSVGMPELLIILVIALIIFGPRKLPELGRSLGKSLGEFKRASNELRNTLEEEVRIEEQKEQKAKIEAEQTSAIDAAKSATDTHDSARKDDDRTVSRTNTGTPA